RRRSGRRRSASRPWVDYTDQAVGKVNLLVGKTNSLIRSPTSRPRPPEDCTVSKRDGFEPGVPCWIDTWQPDADAAVAFYTALFGWDADEAPLDGEAAPHVMISIAGREVAGIGWRPAGGGPDLPTAWGTYIQVADVDATVAA